jgi:hypothetical protein
MPATPARERDSLFRYTLAGMERRTRAFLESGEAAQDWGRAAIRLAAAAKVRASPA